MYSKIYDLVRNIFASLPRLFFNKNKLTDENLKAGDFHGRAGEYQYE